MEIELASIEEPERLADFQWRREVVSGNRRLQAQLIHRVALYFLKTAKPRHARRLLDTLVNDRFGPGFRGAVEFDATTPTLIKCAPSASSRRRAFAIARAQFYSIWRLPISTNCG
jgi:hypothetical protein